MSGAHRSASDRAGGSADLSRKSVSAKGAHPLRESEDNGGALVPDAHLRLDELRSAAALLHRECFIDDLRDFPEGIDGSYLDRVKDAIAATYPVIWTDEQVAKLNEFQSGYGHPFTCGSGDRMDKAHSVMRDEGEDYGQLVATPQGWVCSACDYRQFWAHDFMFNGALPPPFASGMEAATAGETGTGSTEGDSPVGSVADETPKGSGQ